MLCFEEGVTENVGVGGHGYVFVCGKSFPEFFKEGAVVDAQGWGNAGAKAAPVLADGSVGS